MKQTFYLRKPKEEKETLILFSCYFKNEQKQFVYSTRKAILPKFWDFKNNKPQNKGKNISIDQQEITHTLNKYVDEFFTYQSRCELSKTEFTSELLKNHFNQAFGIVSSKQSSFFDVYEKFMTEKIKRKEWKKTTVKRYYNIKNILLEFEKAKKYKLTFSKVNNSFYTELTDFCYEYKDHFTSTFSRNVGLFKTFMYWAYKKEFTFNKTFMDFVKPQKDITRQEVFSLEEIKFLNSFDCSSDRLTKVKDVFIFQSLTGLRGGELKRVNKRVTFDNYFVLKEEKDSSKPDREIPLTDISKGILMKYNYELPIVTIQKCNDYIKEVIEEAGFTHEVEFTRTKGVEQKTFVKKFHERISSHTARRTFITIMRNNGIADKTIMSISGHRDIKSFNIYHQVNNTARIDAVQSVFGGM
jgi:site-specific recombinase XerD